MKLLHKTVLITLFLGLSTSYSKAQTDSLNYLALGDSYTIGESVPENQRWPVILQNELNEEGFKVKSPEILATTGWTTDELIHAISEAELNSPYEMVSLLIGVNNQYRGYEIGKFVREFTFLLEKAISLAGGDPDRVFVVSIPDYGITPFGKQSGRSNISSEINEYNSIKKGISNEYNVRFIDITRISRKAENDKTLLADDELHPSGTMYRQWVEKILPVIEPVLEEMKE